MSFRANARSRTAGKRRRQRGGPQRWPRGSNKSHAVAFESLEDRRLLSVSTTPLDDNHSAGNSGADHANVSGVTFAAEDAEVGTVVTVNGDQDFANQPDVFLIERDAGDPTMVKIFRNGVEFDTIELAELGQINVNGFGGNDSLTVNAANGLITIPGGIQYDGGDGFDNLKLLGGNPQTETLAVGALAGSGKDTQTGNGDVQVVDFENVEPVVTGGAQTNFNITSIAGLASLLDGANAINYVQSEEDEGLGVDATWGKVTVDNFEPIYFQNKTNLVIDAGAGSDEINLNNPSTPTGLDNIGVNGDDPTASDVLIVNGTTGDDVIEYSPLGAGEGVVTVSGLPTMAFQTIEHLIINGQGGTSNGTGSTNGDALLVDTAAITGKLVLTPGTSFDSGRIDFETNPSGGFIAPSLEFLGLDLAGSLAIFNGGNNGNDDQVAANVDFVYRGTDLSDTFTVAPDNSSAAVELNDQIPVFLSDVIELTLAGLDGDDEFNVPVITVLEEIVIDGGNPGSGSDVLNYLAATDEETRVDFQTAQIIADIVGVAPVAFGGVETVNVVGSDGSTDSFVVVGYGLPSDVHTLNLDGGDTEGNDDDVIAINATTDPDTINYTPLSGSSARITRSEGGPQVNISQFNNNDGNLTVNNQGNVGVMNVLASGAADTIDVVQVGDDTRVTVNAVNVNKWVPVDLAEFSGLTVFGNLGDDTLVVDNSQGLIQLSSGITYDGGSGDDELQLVGTTEIQSATYNVGQNPGEGHVMHVSQPIIEAPSTGGDNLENDVVQNVFFKNLEPVIDTVVANSLTVNATNGDNAINYIEGPNSNTPVTGLVSIDNFETIEFANKTNLIINALAGSDEVNLNNPSTPTGLENIGVNGGDPTASDVLIVNGTAGDDEIIYTPLGADEGVVTVNDLPTIAFETTEHLIVNGQGGEITGTTNGDMLLVDTAAIGGTLVLTPGSSYDSGRVDFQTNPLGGFIAPSLEFLGLDEGGELAVDNSGTNGEDVDFVYRGTDLSDTFTVSPDNSSAMVELNDQIPVFLSDVIELTLAGLDGDDTFNVPIITVLEDIVIDGGNPGSGSDVLNYTPNDDTTTTIDFDTAQITSSVAAAAPVSFGGAETINILGDDASADEYIVLDYGIPSDVDNLNLVGNDADNDDGDTIIVNTTTGPDTIHYTPLSGSSARITRSEGGPQINISEFNNDDGNLTVVNPANIGVMNVLASGASDTIDVTQVLTDTTRVTVNAVNVNKWVPVDFAEFNGLAVEGDLGDDTLVVDNSGGLITLPSGITYDGGSGDDELQLVGNTEIDIAIYTVGQNPGEGVVIHETEPRVPVAPNLLEDNTEGEFVQKVFFKNLEPVIDTVVANSLTVNATNGDNAINYIEGPNSNTAVVGNVPSGLVSVDNFETIEFANKTTLVIDALAGDDKINLNNPVVPEGLEDIQVIGGDPTASDVLVINGTTNMMDEIVYRPDGADSGTVDVDNLVPVAFDMIEHLIVNGQGGEGTGTGSTNGDTLLVDTSAINGTLVLTPGTSFDSGRVDFQSNPFFGFIAPSVEFLGLDIRGILRVENVDAEVPNVDFVYLGTDLSDRFGVFDNGTEASAFLNGQIPVMLEDVDDLTLAGLDGDDEFDVTVVTTLDEIIIDGGNPGSGSDVLNYFAEPNTTTTIDFEDAEITSTVVDAASVSFGGVETINLLGDEDPADAFVVQAYGAPTDVETLNLDGGDFDNNDNDTIAINTTTGPNTINYTPLSPTSARITRSQGGPQINISQFNDADGNLLLQSGGSVDALNVFGSETADAIDVIRPATNTARTTVNVEVVDAFVKWMPIDYLGLTSLQVLGGLGNDTLEVDNSGGLVDLPGGITYDGGADFDALRLTGTTQIDTSTYTVGPQPGSGMVVHTIGDPFQQQQVFFSNLEPFTDDVIAIAIVVNGTNADNAINYVQSEVDAGLGVDPTWGKVTVDGFEPNYFKNKAFLTINALAGSDEINLNNPSTPDGLTQINIIGNDPTASDTLIVNGTNAADDITYRPDGADSGTVDVDGLPPIVFNTVEELIVNGQGSFDGMFIDTSEIEGRLVLTPGSAFDRGRVDFQTNPAGGFIAPSLEFLSLNVGGGLVVTNVDGELAGVDFVYRGTDLSDVFTVIDAGNSTRVDLNDQVPVFLEDVGDLTLAGLNGNDVFNVPVIPLLRLENILLDGGNPDGGSDTLNYTPNANTVTTVNFTTAEVTNSAVGAAPVAFDGVEVINVLGDQASADNYMVVDYGVPTDVLVLNLDGGNQNGNDTDTITVNTTLGPDTINYTPLSFGSARITRSQGGPQINISQFNNTPGNLVVDNPGSVDALNVFDSADSDTIEVIRADGDTIRVSVDAGPNVWVPIDYADLDALTIFGDAGSDTLDVDNTNGLVDLPSGITYDGGSGVDLLRLIGDTEIDTATYWVGQQPDEGRIVHVFDDGEDTFVQRVFFDNLEPVIDIVIAASLTVNANNADNAINYVEGPNSNQAPVGNVPSGLVSVDEFETIEFANKAQLVINALAGSDEINLNNPTTPEGLDDITVNGGDPTASDVLIVNGVPDDAEVITYRPNGADSGIVTVGALPVVAFDTTEHLIVNGLGADFQNGDVMRIDTSEIQGTLVLTPGSAFDRGQVDFRTNPPAAFIAPSLEYLGLGLDARLEVENVDGQLNDVDFVYRGTDTSDVFRVINTDQVALNSQIRVVLTDVNNLTLAGLAGDDTFNVVDATEFNELLIDGGEPSASDVLNLMGLAGDDNVEISFFSPIVPAALPVIAGIPVGVTVDGLGPTIGVKGVEGVHLTANAGDTDTLTVIGSIEDDTFTYTPTRLDASTDDGRFTNAGFNEVFTFNQLVGDFTIDGGTFAGADEVIVKGTAGPDFITVDSPNRIVTVDDSLGVARKPVILGDNIEIASVEAEGGNDTILVTPAPAIASGPGGAPPPTLVPINLLVNVDGGGPGASDALVVADAGGQPLPDSDFVVVNRSRTPDEGVVRIYRDGTALPDITYVNTEIVSPLLPPPQNPVQDPPLLILGPDLFEQNEFLSTAAFLGSGNTINVTDLAIFPNAFEHRFVPADEDWFRVVAETTGTLDFQAYFRVFASAGPASIPGGGNLNIEAYDALGNLITGFGTNDNTADARVRIPAVAGQTYYVRVFGDENDVFNGYDMTVINEAPPVPWGLELYDVIVAADVAAGVSTTVFTSTSADLSQQDDFYNGKFVHFKSGEANGLRGLIEDYAFAAGTGTFTLAAPLAVTPQEIGEPPVSVIPAAGDMFEIESNDTGRSQNDNITRDDTPLIFLRLDDAIFLHDLPGNPVDDSPPDEVIPIPFQDQTQAPGYRIAIFDEGNVPPQMSDPPQEPVGFASAVPGQEGVYFFEFTTPLSQGSHFLTARVQMIDPADPEQTGFGGRSLTLEIFVDTQPPPVFFGLPFVDGDGLDAGSDTGVIGMPETFNDGITSDTQPTFFGTAEADAVVRLFADLNDNGVLEPTDILIGQTVATPIDGTNQFPGGRWVVKSNVDLNDPTYFPLDGLRRIFATGEDVPGNEGPTPEPAVLEFFIDTQGPQVTEVFITEFPDYNLFGLKPDSEFQGPTPLIFSLTIELQDLPPRVAGFLFDAIKAETAETPGVILLKGDHNGFIEIDEIIVTNLPPVAGQPAFATIELVFDTPLPDDRFTLTLNDTISDLAGNRLDGESDAVEPIGGPFIPPSGDGQPGGDFVARFTVDSRPEIGTYAAANIFIDANGNFFADFPGEDDDFTNRDLNFALGIVPALEGVVSPMGIHDGVFAGNFPREGENGDDENGLVADGFDKLAAYGFDGLIGKFRWLIDVNHDGVINPADGDHATIQPAGFQINGLPVAGNFDGNTTNGDEIGLFDGTKWHFDTNHNYVIDAGDLVVNSSLRGTPITGDFNGDGIEDLGTFKSDQFEFNFGTAGPNWNGQVQATINWGLPGVSELPIAADMDQDGITDIGLYEPARTGTLPLSSGNWQFLLSNDFSERFRGGNQVTALDHPFSPTPLGNDLFAQFGDAFALPVVGNFDPPVAAPAAPTPTDIGPVLGSMTSGPQTVDGQQWYAFQPLRSGTVSVDAESSGANVNVNLYSENFVEMAAANAPAATAMATAQVTAGSTYLVRLAGSGANATMHISNDVPAEDRLDTTRDGRTTVNDALVIVNELLRNGPGATPMDMDNPRMYLDTSLNGVISVQDLLQVVNHILQRSAAPAAAPAAAPQTSDADSSAATTNAAGEAVASGLAIGRSGSAEEAAAIESAAADAVYTQLASDAIDQDAADLLPSDAEWVDVVAADSALHEDDEIELVIDTDWDPTE